LAKEVTKAQVCGTNQCIDVTDDAGPGVVEGVAMVKAPPPGAAYVKVRVAVSGAGRWTNRFVPSAGAVRTVDGEWLTLDATATAALRAAARRVEPFRPRIAPPPPEPAEFPWAVVGGAALAALLAAAAARLTLRRRAAAQP
jgi:hypothetical protein